MSKFDPNGQTLLFSTYLGGSEQQPGIWMGSNPAGNVYLTGETDSPDFPTAVPQQGAPGGAVDAFVAAPTGGVGARLLDLLGGGGDDRARAIAVDALGRVLVGGETASPNFPTVAPLQANSRGGDDGFVSLSSRRSELTLAFPPTSEAAATSGCSRPAIGATLYLTGETNSNNFPLVDPTQASRGGGRDAFVARLDLPSLAFSTFLGGSDNERGNGIAVDAAGNPIVVGETDSDDFPIVAPFQGSDVAGTMPSLPGMTCPPGSRLLDLSRRGRQRSGLCRGQRGRGGPS